MEFEIKRGMKRAVPRRKRFLTQEKRSFLSLNGLVVYGVEQPFVSQAESGPSSLVDFLLFPILITLYIYLACRVGSLIARWFRSYAAAGHPAGTEWRFLGGERVTLFGRLKSGGETHSDGAPHFILENATNSQIPDLPPVPLEVSLTPSSQQAKAMNDYLGKRLLVAGKIHFNALKGEPEVVPELVMEVIP